MLFFVFVFLRFVFFRFVFLCSLSLFLLPPLPLPSAAPESLRGWLQLAGWMDAETEAEEDCQI